MKVGCFSRTNVQSTHTLMLSWKVQFLLHISSPGSQIWKKFQDKRWLFFFKGNFLSTHALCYLGKYSFYAISPPQIVWFEKFHDKRGLFFFTSKCSSCPYLLFQVFRSEKLQHKRGLFFQDEHSEYPQPYVILKMQFLLHISSPSSWIWKFLTGTAFF